MTKKFKNSVFSFSRVLAMCLIIMCHLCAFLGIDAGAQFFNVGVELFLLISGGYCADKACTESVTVL